MGGGRWNSQSLQFPWPSFLKHKQTKSLPTYELCLSKRKARGSVKQLWTGCWEGWDGPGPLQPPKPLDLAWPPGAGPPSLSIHCSLPSWGPNSLSVRAGMFWEPGLRSISRSL